VDRADDEDSVPEVAHLAEVRLEQLEVLVVVGEELPQAI